MTKFGLPNPAATRRGPRRRRTDGTDLGFGLARFIDGVELLIQRRTAGEA
jgi:hypothetical protein